MRKIFISSTLISLALCGCGEVQSVTPEPNIRPAKLTTVVAATTSRTLSFPAVIEAENSSELTFQVPGQITSLTVLEGDPVEEGQVIARIEDRDYLNSLTQAQAQFENAETEFQRAQRLFDQDAVSRSVYETRQTNLKVARAALDTARKTTGDTILMAPFSGVISKIHVKRFQNIQAKEPIASIQSTEMVALLNAPSDLVARTPQLEPKDTSVILDSAPSTRLPAVFREASGQADPATQTYEISFSFTPPDNIVVLPGMTASITTNFNFNDAQDIAPSGLSVPIAAVVSEGGSLFVWRVDPVTMKISKAPIVTGQGMSETDVIVTQGLLSGDIIVSAGGSYLNEGTRVREWVAK